MFAELLWIELNHYEVTRVMSQRVCDDGRLVLVDGSMYSNSYVFIDLSAPAAFPFTYQLICAAGSRQQDSGEYISRASGGLCESHKASTPSNKNTVNFYGRFHDGLNEPPARDAPPMPTNLLSAIA